MRRTRPLAAAALAVAALALAALRRDDRDDTRRRRASPAARFPVTVGSVTLDERPERIVSLSPTATEMLFAIGAGTRSSPSTTSRTTRRTRPKTDLSGYEPNVEAIAAKDPDLVVLSDDIDEIVGQLDRAEDPGRPAAGRDHARRHLPADHRARRAHRPRGRGRRRWSSR